MSSGKKENIQHVRVCGGRNQYYYQKTYLYDIIFHIIYNSIQFSVYFLICDFLLPSAVERLKVIISVQQMNKTQRIQVICPNQQQQQYAGIWIPSSLLSYAPSCHLSALSYVQIEQCPVCLAFTFYQSFYSSSWPLL